MAFSICSLVWLMTQATGLRNATKVYIWCQNETSNFKSQTSNLKLQTSNLKPQTSNCFLSKHLSVNQLVQFYCFSYHQEIKFSFTKPCCNLMFCRNRPVTMGYFLKKSAFNIFFTFFSFSHFIVVNIYK